MCKLVVFFRTTCFYIFLSELHAFFFRDGCRPFIEVYQGDDKVLSTIQEYERMRLFNVAEGKVSELKVPEKSEQ